MKIMEIQGDVLMYFKVEKVKLNYYKRYMTLIIRLLRDSVLRNIITS